MDEHGSQVQYCVHWWVLMLVMLDPGGDSASRELEAFC
jgi:hypothetical protein